MDSYGKKKLRLHDFFEIAQERITDRSSFSGHNNISLTHLDEHFAEGEVLITEASLNPRRIVHGGCIVALADTLAGTFVMANTLRGCTTLSCNMNYLNPGTGAKLKCVVTPVKMGKSICICSAAVTDENQVPVASGTFTFFLLEKLSL